jgi:hypothetical protein
MTSPVTNGSQQRGVSGNKRNTTGTTAGSGRRTNTRDNSSSNSRRVVNWSVLTGVDNASRRNMANDDEEALKWAALERLPTYERVRNTLFQKASEPVATGTPVPRRQAPQSHGKRQREILVQAPPKNRQVSGPCSGSGSSGCGRSKWSLFRFRFFWK